MSLFFDTFPLEPDPMNFLLSPKRRATNSRIYVVQTYFKFSWTRNSKIILVFDENKYLGLFKGVPDVRESAYFHKFGALPATLTVKI